MSGTNENDGRRPNPSDDDDARDRPPRPEQTGAWQGWWQRTYEQYAAPLERYAEALLARYGVKHIGGEEPPDLVQGFFAALMKTDGLRRWNEIRDTDRYLNALFWRHVRGRHRHAMAQRRRPQGGFAIYPLEAVRARALPMPIEDGPIQRAVADALTTLRERRPQYAAVIDDLIEHDDGGRVRPSLADRLGVAARNLATLKYRARRAFACLFMGTLALMMTDERLLEEIRRQFMPWLPIGPA